MVSSEVDPCCAANMSDEKDALVWGLIGCGDVAEVKSAPVCFRSNGSEVVICMRRDEEKAKDFAARHSIPLWSSSCEDLYLQTEGRLNSVYIATPPSSHKSLAVHALSKGCNVYLEKPIALNAQEAIQIRESLESSPGCKLSVAHYRRELPLFRHVKRLLEENSIGSVRYCNLRCWKHTKPEDIKNAQNWRLDPAVSGGGYFHDLAPHQLDILLFLFGHPLQSKGLSSSSSVVTKDSTRRTPADTVCGMSLFPNGVVFNGSWCFTVPEEDAVDECVIVGSHGSISFPFFGSSGAVKLHKDIPSDDAVKTTEVSHFKHPKHIQEPMIRKVLAYFKGENGNPCSVDDAIAVMNMIDKFANLDE